MSYREFISAMQMLYSDLQASDVTELLDLSKPALNCDSNETFQQRNITWPRDIKQEI